MTKDTKLYTRHYDKGDFDECRQSLPTQTDSYIRWIYRRGTEAVMSNCALFKSTNLFDKTVILTSHSKGLVNPPLPPLVCNLLNYITSAEINPEL